MGGNVRPSQEDNRKDFVMKYLLGDRQVNIDDKQLETMMTNLELTKEEAIQVWLEDEGYLDNEEQNALETKARENRITATIHQASAIDKTRKKTQKERCRRENPTKEMVIAEIAKILPDFATSIQVINPGKLIAFRIGEDNFELDLKQKRKSKKG